MKPIPFVKSIDWYIFVPFPANYQLVSKTIFQFGSRVHKRFLVLHEMRPTTGGLGVKGAALLSFGPHAYASRTVLNSNGGGGDREAA